MNRGVTCLRMLVFLASCMACRGALVEQWFSVMPSEMRWHAAESRLIDSDRESCCTLELPSGRTIMAKEFEVMSPDIVIVRGSRGGSDVRIASESIPAVRLVRGKALDLPGAPNVFLAMWSRGVFGFIETGGRGFPVSVSGAEQSLADLRETPIAGLTGLGSVRMSDGGHGLSTGQPLSQLRRIELAIDTDYEFCSQFDDEASAIAYVTGMIGAVSDIYMRDSNARLELVYLRVWSEEEELYNGNNLLMDFSTQWRQEMGGVDRDVAQLLSGRRDLPFTGTSYFSSLCDYSRGYCVVGQVSGWQFDGGEMALSRRDVRLSAHELAHCCGADHTHNYGFDSCAPTPGEETRGTIMSYCSLHNGGEGNIELRFNSYIGGLIKDYMDVAACVDTDCNMNGMDDAQEVQSGSCADVNGNAVPDECEDCDGDGVLDDVEVASGAADANANGVPDECEPDCNSNGYPDKYDIEMSVSDDANWNNVPDECEEDCDANGIRDFREIGDNLDLDVNRDGRLDACEDCDGDGVVDADVLQRGHGVWVADIDNTRISAFHGRTGGRAGESVEGYVHEAMDLLISESGTVLVASCAEDAVFGFDMLTGAFQGSWVPSGYGGLACASGLAVDEQGDLYVSSRDTGAVLRYDGTTHAYMGEFVASGSGVLKRPCGLTFGLGGQLLVADDVWNAVLEFDGASGSFIRTFVRSGDGGLLGPRGLTFKGDGNLLVAGLMSERVLEYDRGDGSFVGVFNKPLYSNGSTLHAWSLRIGPNGNLLVATHDTQSEILEYDIRSGLFVRTFVGGPYAGLGPITAFDFVPGWANDCNVNFTPDGCDLAVHPDWDANTDGIPDHCENDCNSNGVWDVLEVIPNGRLLDCNFNGVLDECELAGGSADVNHNGIPDECERDEDCNDNGIRDILDIAAGSSGDCDGDSIPDECEGDCDSNGIADVCEIYSGQRLDCNHNGIPDECDLAHGTSQDFDVDGTIDECDEDIDDDGLGNEVDVCDYTPLGATINPEGGPMGDVDDDCVVTIGDYLYLGFCIEISGAGHIPEFGDCADIFDFDADGDVDLSDFAEFQRVIVPDDVEVRSLYWAGW